MHIAINDPVPNIRSTVAYHRSNEQDVEDFGDFLPVHEFDFSFDKSCTSQDGTVGGFVDRRNTCVCWESAISCIVFKEAVFLAPLADEPIFKLLWVIEWNSRHSNAAPVHIDRLWRTTF